MWGVAKSPKWFGIEKPRAAKISDVFEDSQVAFEQNRFVIHTTRKQRPWSMDPCRDELEKLALALGQSIDSPGILFEMSGKCRMQERQCIDVLRHECFQSGRV